MYASRAYEMHLMTWRKEVLEVKWVVMKGNDRLRSLPGQLVVLHCLEQRGCRGGTPVQCLLKSL